MPSKTRGEIVDPDEVGFYHCYSRCVRRSYLCGQDSYTGKNFDHRKDWVEQRLEFLSSVMAVELICFAIMDNHMHNIVRIRPDLVRKWPDREVARRWLTVCPGRRETDSAAPPPPTQEQIDALTANKRQLEICRKRLCSLSWHQRFLKEHLARRANSEDQLSGCFFEKRFESIRLLDIYSLLVCAIYVDLNPVRARMAATPETSAHTSVYRRIKAWRARNGKRGSRLADRHSAAFLAPIDEGSPPPDGLQAINGLRASDDGFLPFSLEDYLQLLDWSGREVHLGKRGKIPASCAPILDRLEVDPAFWLRGVKDFGEQYASMAGRASSLRNHAAEHGRRWYRGVGLEDAPPSHDAASSA